MGRMPRKSKINPVSYSKHTLRNWVVAGVLGLGVLGGATKLIYDNNNKPPQGQVQLSPDTIEDLLAKFDKMRESEKEKIFMALDQDLLSNTQTGKIINYINQNVHVDEVRDSNLSTNLYIFHRYTNKMHVPANERTHDLAFGYLKGVNRLIAKSHEKIHYEQHGVIGDFYLLVGKYAVGGDPEGKGNFPINMPPEGELVEFITKRTKKSVSYDEAKSQFRYMVDNYYKTDNVRVLIGEVHAYLSLQPFNNDELYSHFINTQGYNELVRSVSKVDFDRIYDSTIELLGMKNPLESAKIVGQNFGSIDSYVKAVNSIKIEIGTSNARQMGIQYQNTLRMDSQRAIKNAENFIRNGPPKIKHD